MKTDSGRLEGDSGELSDEEFGTGSELYTTAYLILGMLTFWVYNVWSFFETLQWHMNSRLAYFRGLLSGEARIRDAEEFMERCML
jgi:hypothetical protein